MGCIDLSFVHIHKIRTGGHMDHELWDDAVEGGAFVVEGLSSRMCSLVPV
jgi:hypothetical protein